MQSRSPAGDASRRLEQSNSHRAISSIWHQMQFDFVRGRATKQRGCISFQCVERLFFYTVETTLCVCSQYIINESSAWDGYSISSSRPLNLQKLWGPFLICVSPCLCVCVIAAVASIQRLPAVSVMTDINFPMKGRKGMVDWARNSEDKVVIPKGLFISQSAGRWLNINSRKQIHATCSPLHLSAGRTAS